MKKIQLIPKTISLAVLILCMPLSQAGILDIFSNKPREIVHTKPIVEGDLKDIPYENWRATESGRFAHSLKYDDKLAQPAPYQFTKGKSYKQESIDYFEHLCATEGKDYIYRTAKGVDTIAQLRSFEIPIESLISSSYGPQTYKFHPYALESPVFFDEVLSGLIRNELQQKPKAHLENVDFGAVRRFYASIVTNYEIKFNNGEIYNFKYDLPAKIEAMKINPKVKDKEFESVERLDKITARYAFTWKGFSRSQDREFGISGGDLIVIDIEKNEIMAIQRTFIKGFYQPSSPTDLNWEGVGCFEQYKNERIYRNLDFINKKFNEKVKMIDNSPPQMEIMPLFLHKVIKYKNQEER